MNFSFNSIIETYPKTKFQAKTDKIIDECKEFVYNRYKHINLITLRKPSDNKLIKVCAEYLQTVNVGKGASIVSVSPNKMIDIQYSVDTDFKLGLVIPYVNEITVTISQYGKKQKVFITKDDAVESGTTSDAVNALRGCLTELNDYLARGALHACSKLQSEGFWYTDRTLSIIIRDVIDGKECIEEFRDHIETIFNVEVATGLTIEQFIDIDGFFASSVPALSIDAIYQSGEQEQTQALFVPKLTDAGWTLNAVVCGNMPQVLLDDVSKMSVGVNNLVNIISKRMKTNNG